MGDVKKCIKMLNWLTGDMGDVPTGPGKLIPDVRELIPDV